ncbi:MAG: UbiX family flavin prenyltransferase [Nitrososphaerales archaeon]
MKIVVALSGRGLLIGVKLLQALRRLSVETHVVLDDFSVEEVYSETGLSRLELSSLADHNYANNDFTAPIASGSYQVDGMIIAPCSLKRVSDLAQGYSKDLIGRAADVTLKEGRILIISLSETPLSKEDISNLIALAEAGATILPATPLFYTGVEDLNEAIGQIVGRMLDRFNLKHGLYKPWGVK